MHAEASREPKKSTDYYTGIVEAIKICLCCLLIVCLLFVRLTTVLPRCKYSSAILHPPSSINKQLSKMYCTVQHAEIYHKEW